MGSEGAKNLDLACAELGAKLAESNGVDEKLFSNALSVLEEQGLYACFLYLKAKGNLQEKKGSEDNFISQCHNFLKSNLPMKEPNPINQMDILKTIEEISKDLDRLLFARDLMRQAFVYGRYHAKAKESAKGSR